MRKARSDTCEVGSAPSSAVSSVVPEYQGIRVLGTVTLSPSRAQTGMAVTASGPSLPSSA